MKCVSNKTNWKTTKNKTKRINSKTAKRGKTIITQANNNQNRCTIKTKQTAYKHEQQTQTNEIIQNKKTNHDEQTTSKNTKQNAHNKTTTKTLRTNRTFKHAKIAKAQNMGKQHNNTHTPINSHNNKAKTQSN